MAIAGFRVVALAALTASSALSAAEPGAVLIIPPERHTPALPRETPAAIAEADPARPVTTLFEALERAYWTEPGLLAERARLRGTDFRLPQARAQYGPQIGYEATYGWQRVNTEQAVGGYSATEGWSSTASAVLTQPLFTSGRNASAENGALARIEFQRASLRFNEHQTLLAAIDAYAGVLRERAGVQIAAENLALLERELADTKARFKAREVTSTDLQQVATRVELGKAQLLAARRLSASSEATFLVAVGAPAGVLVQPNPLEAPVRTLEDAYAYAEVHNPVLAAAVAREKISRAQADATRSDLGPRIDLRGRADYGTVTPYSDNFRQTTLRGEVVVSGPIFESGLRRARLGEAEAVNDADWRMIDSSARESRREVADAWNERETLQASLSRLATAVEMARAAYEGALMQERAGLRTTLDVLDLARELINARSTYNTASARAYVAQARLLAAIGALSFEVLAPDAQRYDPETHFRRVRNNGDFPLLTPLVRALDRIATGSRADQPRRDPAAPLAAPGAEIGPEAGD